jgi:colanic acid/amylovoran biosynthesis glycosyltransferase
MQAPPQRIGYVVKMYPRFSETFILNEILAHEAAGLSLEIVSLRAPTDGRFHEALAEVRAPVYYLPESGSKAADFWNAIRAAAAALPGLWNRLEAAADADPRDVYQALLLAQYVQERGITHLHAHFATVATTVARLAASFAGMTYSFTAHAKDLYHESVDPVDLRRKLRDAAAVVTVSDYNVQFLATTYGADADKVCRIYNGLDLKRFRYTAPATRPPLIVSVSRLVEKKGLDVLVEACALLRDAGRNFQCAIAGSGPEQVALAAQIARLGLNEQVLLVGPLPQSQVMELIQTAAAFAAPCVIGTDGNRDGLPTALLEAMALGTPCVATDVTGIPEILHHGVTGLMVPEHNPAALAQALDHLLSDAELRERLALAARRLITATFDIHANTAQLRTLFSPVGADREVGRCV